MKFRKSYCITWQWRRLHCKQNVKVFTLKILCDGQGADRQAAILCSDRSCFIKKQGKLLSNFHNIVNDWLPLYAIIAFLSAIKLKAERGNQQKEKHL